MIFACARSWADTAIFRNGDVLAGSLENMAAREDLRWTHPDAAGSIALDPGSLAEIQFPVARTSPASNGLPARFELRGGESFEAGLVSLTAERVSVHSMTAGAFEFPRRSLLSIVPAAQKRAVIFEGPAGLEGWTLGRVVNSAVGETGDWKFQDGAFFASKSASIARAVGLPGRAAIQFDLRWKGYFHLAVALATDYLQPVNLANKDGEPDFGGFYSLQINNFSANLLPVKKGEPIRYLGQVALPMLSQRSAAHVDIRINREKKLVALLLDGVMIKQWTDPEGFTGTGGGLRFVYQGQGVVKLSALKVTDWDGQFEELITNSPVLKEDSARLRNGDRMLGAVESIQDGRLALVANGARLEVPLARVLQIEFARANLAPQPLGPGEVRAFFEQGGQLRLSVDSYDATGLTARHAALGLLKFRPGSLTRLRFIDPEEPKEPVNPPQ